MRILRLDLGDGIGTVDLHPFISVLYDLDPIQTDTLVTAVRSLTNGYGHHVRGLVENDGHLIELGDLTSQSIGPLTTEDNVVAVDRLAAPTTPMGGTAAELGQLRRRAEIDAVLVEEIRADLDPSVAARVFQLEEKLRDADGGASALTHSRIARVAEAVAVAETKPPFRIEVPEPVEDLIIGWEAYCSARLQAADHLEGLQRRAQSAEAALAQAMQDAAEAQQRARPLLLSTDDDARLEELVNPTDKKRRSRALTGEEQAEVDALLAKISMPSYTSYALYRLSPSPPPEQMVLLGEARQRLADAQAEAEEARAALTVDTTASGLDLQFDEVKAEARRHLGPMLPNDLGAALSELVVQVENPEWLEAMRALYERLLNESIEVPEDIEPEQLVGFAQGWIDTTRAVSIPVAQIDPVALEADLALAQRDFERHARAMVRIDQLEAQAVASAARVAELEGASRAGSDGPVRPIVDRLTLLVELLRGQSSRSVPIVVTGDFEAVPETEVDVLMAQLEGLAQHHQLILATNRSAVAGWAATVGLRRALRSTPSRVVEG